MERHRSSGEDGALLWAGPRIPEGNESRSSHDGGNDKSTKRQRSVTLYDVFAVRVLMLIDHSC